MTVKGDNKIALLLRYVKVIQTVTGNRSVLQSTYALPLVFAVFTGAPFKQPDS